MKLTTCASALAFASGAMSAPSLTVEKRNPTGSFELIAYGAESTTIPMFFSDGLAYAGDSSKWTYGTTTTDVTFVITDTELITTATTSGVTLDNNTLLYIRPTTDEVLPVGFTGNGYATPSDATTEEFLFYGTYLMWEEEDGVLSDSFRLLETNVSGVYQYYYDISNTYPSGYITPVVKSESV
ncbi:uncharacterized protein N7483_012894 [Penicillium malachiteum]|uniref:uncharacterized protein n=1 Tax=Penicillium malachiteum TaxID=1324776 RepID=UPI002547BB78|nr:uncharacterized protein N7483_012894 [Penicillium malachiteum]KAJ5715713.1 hypothetical protein N7483_012894 [Penicillium malachiteum]